MINVWLLSIKSLRIEAIILIFYQILVYDWCSTSFDKIFASRSDNFNFSPARKKISITHIFPSNEIKNLSSSREDLRYPPISPYFKLASWSSKRRKKKSNGILSRWFHPRPSREAITSVSTQRATRRGGGRLQNPHPVSILRAFPCFSGAS